MAPYTPLPQTQHLGSHHDEEDDDILESLQNIPSHFDLALNGSTNRMYLSTNPKTVDGSLLDPEQFRRLSTSTISSTGPHSRTASPYPDSRHAEPRTWKTVFWDFWHRNQGLFLVSFSQLFGALMNVTTRLLELEGEGMQPFQILFTRQCLTMIFCSVWMWWKSIPDFPLGPKDVRWLLVCRSLSGFFGIYGMYYSLQYLPVADAVVITFLAPSVASYACYLFLKEPFTKSSQYASLISLLGVFLIARPASFFSSSSKATTENPRPTNSTNPAHNFPVATPTQRLDAVGVALLGVLGAAGAFTSIRWIGKRAHPLISVNYFSTFCTLISFLALTLPIFSGVSFKLPVNLRQWCMLFFLGICGFIMQFLLTKGLSHGDKRGGARATNMIYTNMLFALGLDKLVFGQSPGWWSLGGSGLILGSAVWVAVQKGRVEGRVEGGGRGDEEERGGNEEERRGMLSRNEEEDEVPGHEREGEVGSFTLGGSGGVELRELPVLPPRG